MRSAIINGTQFNIGWFAIILTESTLAALVIVPVYLLVHHVLQSPSSREWLLIAGVSLFGAALDQLLFATGVMNIGGASALAPLWLTCLWPLLATTLCHAFASLQTRLLIASVLGAVSAAGSYVAGTRLTVVDFGDPVAGPLIIGACWALLLPALLLVARQLGEAGDSTVREATA